VQSERLDRYQDAARRLIEQGDAYECYCSSARLDAVRAEQTRLKQPPRYDRRCRVEAGRAASRAEAAAEGRGPVVRFATPPEGSVTLQDAIHGATTFDLSTIDDFVMLKSDGYPTYHLAYIVDDEDMKITHVMRGDEWIPSAPRHLLIYRALGIEPPVIAHLPVILGPDGSKLSKRHGATSVFEYLDQGYLPDALVNFLGLIGWSLDDKTDIISREQFIANFSLERVNKSPGVFNVEKLTWMNGVYIREMPADALAAHFAEWLERELPPDVARPLDRALIDRVVPLVRERIKVLSEIPGYCDFFFADAVQPARDDLIGKAYRDRPADAPVHIERIADACAAVEPWTHDALEAALRALAGELGVKAGDLFSLARVAVTGKRVTPPLFESMEIIGRERCVARLRSALGVL
jgi:glutamyl-tRNA synthetase